MDTLDNQFNTFNKMKSWIKKKFINHLDKVSENNNQFYRRLDRIAYRYDLKRRAEYANNKRGPRCDSASLSEEEKTAIRNVWGEYGGDYQVYSFYKQFCGTFDPYYVPDDYYDFAEHIFNLRWSAFFLQHKCNLKYILPTQNRAKVILQKIDGHIVYEDNTEITEQEAIACLKKHPIFMAKIARGTGGGKGVQRIVLNELKDVDSSLRELLSPIDIEFEEVVKQNDFLAQFNPDSVNTLRFVTLNINRRCTVLSTFLRMGAKGSFVDNLSGGQGVLVGINVTGALNDFGVDKKFEKKYKSPTGVKFSGIKIPDFDRIKQQIIEFHKKIPFANLIGWDVTIDTEGNPVVIEINLDSAVIEAHQVFNGPIFGDRLNEVKEYIEKRKPLLRHGMITF